MSRYAAENALLVGRRLAIGSLLGVGGLLIAAQAALAVQSPTTVRLITQDYVVSADGTYVLTTHGEFLARNDSAAHDLAQQALRYSDEMEEMEIVEAYTEKADGTRLPVAESAIFTQVPQGAANFPAFSDQKQKVIVFPNVAAGDTVVYTVREHVIHPMFPGHFMIGDVFPTTLSIEQGRSSVVAPKSMSLGVESHGIAVETQGNDDTVTYRWAYSAPDALARDVTLMSPFDRNPRYFVSSFRDYDEFAKVYADLVAPLIVVTPKIQATADQITAGISDRRQKAAKIYDWVSANVRYVGIELGRGAVIPHSAEMVLANGYGDCKDHTVIFAALLAAAGIDSEVVLINLDNAYTLSEKPTLAQLNHAISYLPEFGLYADTTAGLAPFGTLPFTEYGKPVVHATAAGGALRQVPALAAGATEVSVRSRMKVGDDGRISGETGTTATGPYSLLLRTLGADIQARGPENAAAIQLQALGVPGTGTFELTSPHDLAPEYTIVGRFDVDENPQILAGGGFTMPGGLRLIQTTGDQLMGPLWNTQLGDKEPTPCFNGHTHEELSLELPAGWKLVTLPADSEIANDQLKFTARWSQDGSVVTVARDFVATVDKPLCEGDVRKAAAAALAKIRASYTAQLMLTQASD